MVSEARGPLQGQVGRILIVDDHELARTGLVRMLEGEPDIEVVGEAARGDVAVTMCAQLLPDLVLMDVRMPGMDGLTATAEIHLRSPRTNVLIFTLYEDQEYIFRAIKAGASGYILKDASKVEILSTVRKVLDGESGLDPSLTMRLLRRMSGQEAPSIQAPMDALTPREREVLAFVVEGFTNQEIALRLSIGAGTVKSHVEHIISKLGAAGRTQAAVRAVQLGIVVPHGAD